MLAVISGLKMFQVALAGSIALALLSSGVLWRSSPGRSDLAEGGASAPIADRDSQPDGVCEIPGNEPRVDPDVFGDQSRVPHLGSLCGCRIAAALLRHDLGASALLRL